MIVSHRQIMLNLALAIRDSKEVLDYCISNFSRGLDIHVGAYADQIPTEDDSPVLWIFADGDSESVATDEKFSVSAIVAGCPLGPDGEKVINNLLTKRSQLSNGLVVNGANQIIEDLRDIILSVARNSCCGARIVNFTRSESDFAHQPLEWAAFKIEFQFDITLEDIGV